MNPTSFLLVDDDTDDVSIFKEVLEDVNPSISFLSAGDGYEALITLKKQSNNMPDVIFLDLNMPRMDGISLIEEVRVTPNHNRVPILMLTTESQTSFKEKARNAGATGWIVKPFVADNLLAVINKVLR